MGGGFTPLPTLPPWAQVDRPKVPRPTQAKCSDCRSLCPTTATSQNCFFVVFDAVLEAIWGGLGLHFLPPAACNIQSILNAGVKASANVSQPRNTVNSWSRSTCKQCVSHCKYVENRLKDPSRLPCWATLLARRFRMASKTRLEHDFFGNDNF